jgi:hypothetical protein
VPYSTLSITLPKIKSLRNLTYPGSRLAITLMGISPYWQTVASGAVVVAAISIDPLQRMIASRKMGSQR